MARGAYKHPQYIADSLSCMMIVIFSGLKYGIMVLKNKSKITIKFVGRTNKCVRWLIQDVYSDAGWCPAPVQQCGVKIIVLIVIVNMF